MSNEIRRFATGGTRDTDKGKLDFEGFLSPDVLVAYAEYLNKHRTLPNGELRDSDNWQQMFGDKHFDVCIKSLLRHTVDLWLLHRDSKPRFEKGAYVTEADALGGIIFNAMAYWFKLIKDEQSKEMDVTSP